MASLLQIAEALQFDGADLDSNRAGLISSSQHRRLWRRDAWQLAGAAACLLAGGVFNVALLAGWMGTVRGKGAGLGLALMAIGVILGYASVTLWLDLLPRRVATAEGSADLEETRGRSGAQYFVRIADARFNVPLQVYSEVGPGRWRAYYLQRSNTLLSLEPL